MIKRIQQINKKQSLKNEIEDRLLLEDKNLSDNGGAQEESDENKSESEFVKVEDKFDQLNLGTLQARESSRTMQDRSIRERSKAFVGDSLNDDEDLIDFFDANLAEFGK